MAILNSLPSKALTITQHREKSRTESNLQSTNSAELAIVVIRRAKNCHLKEPCDIERLANSAPASSSKVMGVMRLQNSELGGIKPKNSLMKVLDLSGTIH